MFRWVVNFGLLVLPIAVTIGILLGIQTHRIATGQPPLWVDNDVTTVQSCEKAFGIHPESKGQEYTLNPNQWGWNETQPGGLCIDVETFNNRSYATNTTAPEFSVTWRYDRGPPDQPVHAFPNIKVDGSVMPISLKSLAHIEVDIEWSYGVGNNASKTTDEDALTENETNTNVAIDMFLDSDSKKAQDSTKAKFEVMVWFARFGPSTQPIGLSNPGSLDKQTVEGVDFDLYYGQNSLNQYVLSWVATDNTYKFKGDFAPLIQRLFEITHDNFPTNADYLGYMGLGSEAFDAVKNVTFHVPRLSIDIQGK